VIEMSDTIPTVAGAKAVIDLKERAEAAEADKARLEAALQPFADFADPREKMPPDFVITPGSAMARRQLTMADCYAARAVLSGSPDPVRESASKKMTTAETAEERAEAFALDMGVYNPANWPHFDDLVTAFRQAEAAEREACAFESQRRGNMVIAKAIRARGDKP
jgi:hypothetical protein